MLTLKERSRLGGIKSGEKSNQRKTIRIQNYSLSPKLCKTCQKIIPYTKRRNNFCNHSCSASATNTNTIRKIVRTCKYCSNNFYGNKTRKYCSLICREQHAYAKFLNGEIKSRKNLKPYLIRDKGNLCFNCGISEWRGKKLPLEIDHIDGNPSNNLPTNLRILCPNCHSITLTWKAKNIHRNKLVADTGI